MGGGAPYEHRWLDLVVGYIGRRLGVVIDVLMQARCTEREVVVDVWVEVDDRWPFLRSGHHEGGNLEAGSQKEGMVDGRAPTKWFAWLASPGGDYSYRRCSPTYWVRHHGATPI
jgi:hypothetical protein